MLAACALLGVTEVYAAGGAQAIALLAYGSTAAQGEQVEPADVISGPGNVYVAAAKRLVRGTAGTDAEGPTEIGVLADDSAHVAADLISQAEHDVLASCLLITDSEPLLDKVQAELDSQVAAARHRDRIAAALACHQCAEGRLVNGQACLGGHLQREVDREAVGVVQAEGLRAGQH